jgi:hypothetical protein
MRLEGHLKPRGRQEVSKVAGKVAGKEAPVKWPAKRPARQPGEGGMSELPVIVR